MSSFSFTGFDGRDYILPEIPDDFKVYNYYIIRKFGNNAILIIFFDENIEVSKTDSMMNILSDGSEYGPALLLLNGNPGYFPSTNEPLSTYLSNNPVIIYSSDNLVQYLDKFNSNEGFYWDRFYTEPEEVSAFTLRPIVQEVDERADILKSSFTEVFSILPVLITVLISFIGIRKGLSFLMSQINKC